MQPQSGESYLLVTDPDDPDRYFVYERLKYPFTPGRDSVPEDEFRSLLGGAPANAVQLDPESGADVIKIARSNSLGINP